VTISDGQGGTTVGVLQVTMTRQAIVPGGGNLIASVPGGAIEGIFHSTPGEEYRFQRSIELTSWEDLGTTIADFRGVLILNDLTPPSPKAFYRINPTALGQ
jgi:hypothetical protein